MIVFIYLTNQAKLLFRNQWQTNLYLSAILNVNIRSILSMKVSYPLEMFVYTSRYCCLIFFKFYMCPLIVCFYYLACLSNSTVLSKQLGSSA